MNLFSLSNVVLTCMHDIAHETLHTNNVRIIAVEEVIINKNRSYKSHMYFSVGFFLITSVTIACQRVVHKTYLTRLSVPSDGILSFKLTDATNLIY